MMDKMNGDLRSYLNERSGSQQKISNVLAVDCVLQVAQALQYLHENVIFHQNIKSTNVLIRQDGNAHVYKISDPLNCEVDTENLSTYKQETIVTWSPERLIGESQKASDDVWSLGVLLYRILTADHLFPCATIEEVKSHQNSDSIAGKLVNVDAEY